MINRNFLTAIVLTACAAPLSANSDTAMVSAGDPAGIVRALEAAGYDPVLETDGQDDPMIKLDLSDWSTRIYFYGCDEATHDGCDAVQFSAGFDRKSPWTADKALGLSKDYRFISVRLDDEGDPYIMWDVITGDGIPTKVFLSSVINFSNAIDNARAAIFADDDES